MRGHFLAAIAPLHDPARGAGTQNPRIGPISQPVVVTIPHSLGRAEAMRRLRAGLGGGNVAFAGLSLTDQQWSEDRVAFRASAFGQAASGEVDVAEDHVRIEVRLPWLLAQLAETARALMQEHGHKLLTKR